MEQSNVNNPFSLERARIEQGNEACAELFKETVKTNEEKAAMWLQDGGMTFPCLFLILPQLEGSHLSEGLSPVLKASMEITLWILSVSQVETKSDVSIEKSDTVHSALRWMLETGANAKNTSSSYRKVIDIVISILIHTYRDKFILPVVADLIFSRRKNGENVHDLIWAYFCIEDAHALRLIAGKLPNADQGEAEFIRDLLGIEESKNTTLEAERDNYLDTLDNNILNLQFRAENKQYMSRPVVCALKTKEVPV